MTDKKTPTTSDWLSKHAVAHHATKIVKHKQVDYIDSYTCTVPMFVMTARPEPGSAPKDAKQPGQSSPAGATAAPELRYYKVNAVVTVKAGYPADGSSPVSTVIDWKQSKEEYTSAEEFSKALSDEAKATANNAAGKTTFCVDGTSTDSAAVQRYAATCVAGKGPVVVVDWDAQGSQGVDRVAHMSAALDTAVSAVGAKNSNFVAQSGSGMFQMGYMEHLAKENSSLVVGNAVLCDPRDVKVSYLSEHPEVNKQCAHMYILGKSDTDKFHESPARLAKIKDFEGYREFPYDDLNPHRDPPLKRGDHVDGKLTVGYGHVVGPGEDYWDKGISIDDANKLLRKELDSFEGTIAKTIKPEIRKELNQNQIDSLISIGYNAGPYGIETYSYGKFLNKGEFSKVGPAMELINKDPSGEVSQGLVDRRRSEANLFYSPVVSPPQPDHAPAATGATTHGATSTGGQSTHGTGAAQSSHGSGAAQSTHSSDTAQSAHGSGTTQSTHGSAAAHSTHGAGTTQTTHGSGTAANTQPTLNAPSYELGILLKKPDSANITYMAVGIDHNNNPEFNQAIVGSLADKGQLPQCYGNLQAAHAPAAQGANATAATATAHPTGQDAHSAAQNTHAAGQTVHPTGQPSHDSGQPSHAPDHTHPAGQADHPTGQPSHDSGQPSHAPDHTHPAGQADHPTGQPSHAPDQAHAASQTGDSTAQTSKTPEQAAHSTAQISKTQEQGAQAAEQIAQSAGNDGPALQQGSQPSGHDARITPQSAPAGAGAADDPASASGQDTHTSSATAQDQKASGAASKDAAATADATASGDAAQGVHTAITPTQDGKTTGDASQGTPSAVGIAQDAKTAGDAAQGTPSTMETAQDAKTAGDAAYDMHAPVAAAQSSSITSDSAQTAAATATIATATSSAAQVSADATPSTGQSANDWLWSGAASEPQTTASISTPDWALDTTATTGFTQSSIDNQMQISTDVQVATNPTGQPQVGDLGQNQAPLDSPDWTQQPQSLDYISQVNTDTNANTNAIANVDATANPNSASSAADWIQQTQTDISQTTNSSIVASNADATANASSNVADWVNQSQTDISQANTDVVANSDAAASTNANPDPTTNSNQPGDANSNPDPTASSTANATTNSTPDPATDPTAASAATSNTNASADSDASAALNSTSDPNNGSTATANSNPHATPDPTSAADTKTDTASSSNAQQDNGKKVESNSENKSTQQDQTNQIADEPQEEHYERLS